MYQTLKKPTSHPVCPVSGQRLNGLPARRPSELTRLSKSKKTVRPSAPLCLHQGQAAADPAATCTCGQWDIRPGAPPVRAHGACPPCPPAPAGSGASRIRGPPGSRRGQGPHRACLLGGGAEDCEEGACLRRRWRPRPVGRQPGCDGLWVSRRRWQAA